MYSWAKTAIQLLYREIPLPIMESSSSINGKLEQLMSSEVRAGELLPLLKSSFTNVLRLCVLPSRTDRPESSTLRETLDIMDRPERSGMYYYSYRSSSLIIPAMKLLYTTRSIIFIRIIPLIQVL